ncbi:hypothetical protein SAMN04488603_104305 [Paenibacillus sp. cl130]|nr:hypothetical protein SAMN04488603_104305 [Paenibacillus sp. cl130]
MLEEGNRERTFQFDNMKITQNIFIRRPDHHHLWGNKLHWQNRPTYVGCLQKYQDYQVLRNHQETAAAHQIQ